MRSQAAKGAASTNDALALAFFEASQCLLKLRNIINDYFPSQGSINLSITVRYEVAKTPNIIPGILRKS